MPSAIEIFCCYSRKDQELLENLKSHLAPLRRHGLITIWNDTDISPGTNYEDEIKKHLDSAHIILLLVSPDFMNSDYCYSMEMERAMERHNKGEARVVPIILRSVLFKDAPFGKIQSLPRDAKPVKRWADPDDAFFDVAAEIKKIAEELLLAQSLREALSLFDTGQFTEALHMYEKALRLNSASADALWGKGESLRMLERYEEALSAYEQATQADPGIISVRFYQRKGLVLAHLQRYDDALVSYQQAIDLNPNSPRLYLNKVELLLHLKRFDEALEVLDRLTHLRTEVVDYQIEKGDLLLKLKRFEEALTVYGSLLVQDPGIAKAHKGKGLALLGLKRYYEALPVFADATGFNPNDADAYKGQGDLFYHLERYEDALTSYEQAIQFDSNNASAYTGKGDALAKLEQYEDAMNAYEQAISLNNNELANYRGKAFVHEQLAQKAHLKASQLFADQFTLLRTLGGHSASVRCVFLSEDGQRLISGSYDKTIKVWDMQIEQVTKIIPGFLAYILDTETEQELRTLTRYSGPVGPATLRVDKQILISRNHSNIEFWYMQTEQKLRTLTGHSKTIYCLVLSTDGQTLVSGSEDGTIKIWGKP